MSAIQRIFPLGLEPWQTSDPFLFCVYHQDDFPEGNEKFGPNASLAGRSIGQDFVKKDGWRMYHGQTVPGFPQHPHRGFETITIAKQGLVDHSDSLGAAGRFGNGDVQWMTAGKGVLHSEMFPLLKKDEKNPLVLFQIWLNLPAKSKLVEPYFGMLWREEIPVFLHADSNGNKTTVDVIAGSLNDVEAISPGPDSWAADPANEVAVWTLRMDSNATWSVPKASAQTKRTLFFYKGSSVEVNGDRVDPSRGIELKANQEAELKNGETEGFFLLLQGKPINEPVVQYGPFVMNTQGEIRETIEEYQRTEFGGWPWPSYDHVHQADSPRFAKHADGKKEMKAGW